MVDWFFLPFIAFICEFVDSSLGMGYGTILTPVLLMLGFEPLAIVPAVLFSEFLSGLAAGFLHNREKNVSFDFANDKNHRYRKYLPLMYIPKSVDAKVFMVLASCSVLGTILAVFLAINIDQKTLKTIIGAIVLSMGVITLLRRNHSHRLSWPKILGLGTIASFNKGLSGGGYGPLVTSGQILSGLKAKPAVAITSFAEALTCFVGITVYFMAGKNIDWSLAIPLATGALISVPFAVKAVKIIPEDKLTLIVGALTSVMGALVLMKL
jgi:uncharacterized protein